MSLCSAQRERFATFFGNLQSAGRKLFPNGNRMVAMRWSKARRTIDCRAGGYFFSEALPNTGISCALA